MVLFATIDFIQPEPVLISFLTMHNDLASINLLYANNIFTVNDTRGSAGTVPEKVRYSLYDRIDYMIYIEYTLKLRSLELRFLFWRTLK